LKLTQILRESLNQRKQRLLKEEISRDDVVTDIESVRTIVDGRRGVAYVAEIGTDPRDWKAIQNMVKDNHLKAMHVKGNEHNAFVVYAQGHEKDAMELKSIAEKYGGYLAWNASKEDSRRIGELLNYKKSEIDDYIAQNYPDDLDEALDVSWNPYEENLNTWERFKELCAQRMASHMNLDDEFNVAEISSRGVRDEEVGKMTAREALDYYIGMCQEAFNDDIEKMFEYWEDFANIDSAYDMEALVDAALYMEDPSSYILDISEDSSLELQPLENDSDDLDEALDVSWNPYEETNDSWWYVDEGYGIDWDGIMEIIKAAANKVVGETAPNRNSYFNIWYDIIDNQVTNASQNVDNYEDDDEVYGVVRSEVEYYTDPESWDDAKDLIVDQMEGYTNIVANKKTLANFQKMGVLIHKMLSSKHKPSLSEALDVSWNPYEEGNYEFKIGDIVSVSDSTNKVKILDRKPSYEDGMDTPELDYRGFLNTNINDAIEAYSNYDDNNPWYLLLDPQFGEEPLWWPQSEWTGYDGVVVPNDNDLGDLPEALDVSWNPYEAWKDKYTENSWLKVDIGSRGEFEGAEIEEIPNIEKYLLDRKEHDYKELLKDLKQNNSDEEDREGEIAYFNEFCGPFRLNKDNPSQWGYGLSEEHYESYYKILSDKYNEWVENMVAVYGVDFADQLTYDDIQQLDKLDYEF